jgi:hypothetical protein
MTFDMHAATAAALVERASAWEFIHGFAADWATPIEAGDGCDATALDACEARLGHPLPAAVRELYELLGRRGDLTSNQDVLLGPDKIYVEDGVLVFREENQGVCWWGVRLDDPSPDPAVIVRYDSASPEDGDWLTWLPTFSTAAMEMVMSETVLFDDDFVDSCDTSAGAEEALAVLRAHTSPLAFPRYPEEEESSLWFVSEDLLVRCDPGMTTVRARSEEALDEIRELLPGNWVGM